MSWCQASGFETRLQVQERTNGYRYVVLRERDENNNRLHNSNDELLSTILRAPLPMCLKSQTAEGLADRLLFEKALGDDSLFAPYLNVLPPSLESFDTLPRFWSEERWSLLGSDDGGGELYQNHLLDLKRLEMSSDEWAQACVDTRSHFLPTSEYCLTPLLDMINHNPHVSTKLTVENDPGHLNLHISNHHVHPITLESNPRSSLSLPQEDEIFISYGEFSNLVTLLNYGFVVPDNPYNEETIQVSLIRQKPIAVQVGANGSFKELGLGRLRRLLANTEELESGPSTMSDALPFVSKRNEMEVMALLGGTLDEVVHNCQQALEQALCKKDTLVATYLQERCLTLERGLQSIRTEYPEFFF